MNLRIVLGKKLHKNFLSSSLNNLFSLNEILIQGDKDISIINISDNEKLIIAGRIVGIRKSRDSLEKIEINTEKFIKFIQNKSIKSLISIIEGRYIFAKIDGNDIEIATDKYGQIDMYYKTDRRICFFI